MLKMSLNFSGKVDYIKKIIKTYPRWYKVLVSQLFNKPLSTIKLSNGLEIVSGDRSLIQNLIYEIFIEEVYNPSYLQINKGDMVVDVGANIGVYSLYAAVNGAEKIYSIEPFPENTKTIRKNFEINELRKPTIITKALLDEEGIERLYMSDLDSHGRMFDHNYKGRFTDYIEVETTTLSKVVTENNIKKIDFLKIDSEGSEGHIISSISNKLWKDIKKMAIEYHNFVSNLSHSEISDKLRGQGFKVVISPSDSKFGYIYAWKTK